MADGAGGTVELQVPFYSWRSLVGCSLVEDKFQTPPAMAYMCLTGKKRGSTLCHHHRGLSHVQMITINVRQLTRPLYCWC
jgi:hypothetical protein